ncbi:hypothetical protein P8C59_000667 [Phyllachora maydis]|uniref:Uncharacterized protein n=1 Tax=Phyllachora maydis TaxID=1825666 RepID=A0AAD9M7Y0_9PEZI|nr:hypothetical protein P8C59_000667 [Phyllachora maydis]
MKSMLAREEPDAADDSDLDLLFAEDDDDAGFMDVEQGDGSDVQMDSSSDDEDHDEGGDELDGEKELENLAREKRRLANKRKAQNAIPAKFRKKVRIDQRPTRTSASPALSTAPSVTTSRPRKKSDRTSWLPTPADMPTRASQRQTTKLSKAQLHEKMRIDDLRRQKQAEQAEKKAKKLEALKKPPMTQAERLAEAASVEKRNSKSLNRWEEAEKQREEERLKKIAALNSRRLEGPFVRFWSGVLELDEAQQKRIGLMVSMEEKPRKKRQTAAEKAAEKVEAAKAAASPSTIAPTAELPTGGAMPLAAMTAGVLPLTRMDSPKPAVDLEKELTCSICTELLFQPLTVLDCLHTFCGACLKEWFGWQALAAETAPTPPAPGSPIFTCPSCRAPVRDTRHNATVATLLDMFLAANPEKARPEADRESVNAKYKPGDNILPTLNIQERSAEQLRLDDEDRRSFRDRRSGPGSRDTSRESHPERRARDAREPLSATVGRILWAPRASEIEEFARQIQEEGLLEGLDLDNIDLSSDYDICDPCYVRLVADGTISAENGVGGWRRCPQGHRTVVLVFLETRDGQRRCIIRDLVGGHKLHLDLVSGAAGLQLAQWYEGEQKLERLVTLEAGASTKALVDSNRARLDPGLLGRLTDKFPRNGGSGAAGTARWAWWRTEPDATDELLFPKGAEITEIEDANKEWFFGVYMGAKGLFPGAYLKMTGPKAPAVQNESAWMNERP